MIFPACRRVTETRQVHNCECQAAVHELTTWNIPYRFNSQHLPVLVQKVAHCKVSPIHGYWLYRVRILIRVPMTRARIVLVEVVSADSSSGGERERCDHPVRIQLTVPLLRRSERGRKLCPALVPVRFVSVYFPHGTLV